MFFVLYVLSSLSHSLCKSLNSDILLTDVWMCHCLPLALSPHDSWVSEQERHWQRQRERVKESFCLAQWSNLSRGLSIPFTSALYGDKSLEQSLLNICFLTVKTYSQVWVLFCWRWSAWTMLHSIKGWCTSTDSYFRATVCYGLWTCRCGVEWLHVRSSLVSSNTKASYYGHYGLSSEKSIQANITLLNNFESGWTEQNQIRCMLSSNRKTLFLCAFTYTGACSGKNH